VGTLTATISIQDKPAPDLFLSLLELEVEDDSRLASAFRIKLAISREDDGLWKILDDERIQLWKKIAISVAIDEEQELIRGYITHIRPCIEPDENSSTLEIVGMDETCLMSLEEKIKDWPKKSDSDIAREVFQNYSLKADPGSEIDDTAIVHDEAVSTIIQRETDIHFLKRLARRNGYECFVKGGKGYFRKPVLSGEPQPVLAAHFGTESNLMKFEATVNALRPAGVEMHQIDTIAKEIQDAVVEAAEQPPLGRDAGSSLPVPNSITPRLFVKHAVTTGQPEMEALCKALFDEAQWFVEARGEINTVCYGAILETRKPVPIKGVGELFSGLYYVTKVKHLFKPDEYKQEFEARRNALAPSGTEDFGGGGGLSGGAA
jgi:phage protein D